MRDLDNAYYVENKDKSLTVFVLGTNAENFRDASKVGQPQQFPMGTLDTESGKQLLDLKNRDLVGHGLIAQSADAKGWRLIHVETASNGDQYVINKTDRAEYAVHCLMHNDEVGYYFEIGDYCASMPQAFSKLYSRIGVAGVIPKWAE